VTWKGDYAFVITHRDEHKLYAIKKGFWGWWWAWQRNEPASRPTCRVFYPLTRRIVRNP